MNPTQRHEQQDAPAFALFPFSESKLRELVRQEVQAAMGQAQIEERLLDAKEAAKFLSVSEDWLYLHWKTLPFARKLAPKVLRFSLQGMLKWANSRPK